MLKNLPSASRRPPLANGRAVAVALLVHAAVAAAIYVSGAQGRDGSVPAPPEPPVTATPPEPQARAAPGVRRTGDPATADVDPRPQSDSPGAVAADVALADSADESALTPTAVSILLHAPDTMRLGEAYEVRVSLPPLATPRRTRGATEDTAPPRNGISPVRQATLAGENMVVHPRTSALQLAEPGAPTVWRWMVTPKEPGRSRLAAEVAVVHHRDGEERIARARGIRKDVHVEATGEQRISRFFAAQWPGLLLLLLVSTIGWLRIRFRW